MSVHIKVCVKAFRCDKEFVLFPKRLLRHRFCAIQVYHGCMESQSMRDIRCLF